MGGVTTKTEDSQEKIANKKIKLAKFGLKFQSAGTLMSIGEARIEKDTPLHKTIPASITKTNEEVGGKVMGRGRTFEEKKASYTTKKWEKAGEASRAKEVNTAPVDEDKAPPKLMSRQKELSMGKSGNTSGSDEDELDFTVTKAIIKKPHTFKLNFKLK